MNISICRDGIELGEWTEEEVREFFAEGRLQPTDMFWREGMSQWEKLNGLIKPLPPFPSAALPPPLPPQPAHKNSLVVQHEKKGRNRRKELRDLIFLGIKFVVMVIAFAGLKEAMPGFLDTILPTDSSRLHQKVVDLRDSMNKQLPLRIDEDTEVQSTSVDADGTFHIRFVASKRSISDIDPRAFATLIRPNLVKSYHSSPFLKLLRDNKLSASYDYYDADGKHLFSETVQPEDSE